MPGLLIKNLPDELHRRLKQLAQEHRRSMAQEAMTILETTLAGSPAFALPPPIQGRIPITDAMIDAAKREGRD